MPFPVKWFTHAMGGAPTLGDTAAGDFIGLLKSCLVTGFNVRPINAMSYDAGEDRVTVDLGSNHGFLRYQVVAISGANQAEYNGEHRVTAIGSDWIQFQPAGAPSAGPATGSSLEIKAAPVGGWSIEAEDASTHRLALKRTAADASDHVFLFENTGFNGSGHTTANLARVRVCETFTDLDTYDQAFQRWWPASHRHASAEWALVADGHTLFWLCRFGTHGKRGGLVLGDIKTVRPGDAAHCLANGVADNTNWTSTANYQADLASLGSTAQRLIARGHQQLPGSQAWQLQGLGSTLAAQIGYPSAANNAFYVATGELLVVEQSSLRGYLPGLLQPLHNASPYHQAVVDNLPELEGVPVLFWQVADSTSGSSATDRLAGFRLDEWFEEVGS